MRGAESKKVESYLLLLLLLQQQLSRKLHNNEGLWGKLFPAWLL